MTRALLDLTIHLESAFHIQAGFGGGGLHQSLVRNHRGEPIIPASSIKGRLRYNARRFAGILKEGGARPDGWIDGTMQHLFGDEDHAGELFVGNAVLARGIPRENPGSPYREIRSGNLVDRQIGSVSESHLRFFEVLPAGLRFTTQMEARLPGRQDTGNHREKAAFQNSLALLLGAMRLLNRLGAGKSRGTGRVTVVVNSLRLGVGRAESIWGAGQRQRWFADFLRHRLPGLEDRP